MVSYRRVGPVLHAQALRQRIPPLGLNDPREYSPRLRFLLGVLINPSTELSHAHQVNADSSIRALITQLQGHPQETSDRG